MNATILKLRHLMNSHDAEGMSGCFSPTYRSSQPVHPNRGFGGRHQVAANWDDMFRGVPDLIGEVAAETEDGDTSWVEWIWHGHHADGSPFEMRGVTVMTVGDDGLIAEARLYMEPVEQDSAAIDEAVRRLAGPAR